MAISLRSVIGVHMAQVRGTLIMLGGAGDVMIRRLLPSHAAFLGFTPNAVPAPTETLVLALRSASIPNLEAWMPSLLSSWPPASPEP
jgi:hypothetical protein